IETWRLPVGMPAVLALMPSPLAEPPSSSQNCAVGSAAAGTAMARRRRDASTAAAMRFTVSLLDEGRSLPFRATEGPRRERPASLPRAGEQRRAVARRASPAGRAHGRRAAETKVPGGTHSLHGEWIPLRCMINDQGRV